jgi:hypothetical protein
MFAGAVGFGDGTLTDPLLGMESVTEMRTLKKSSG